MMYQELFRGLDGEQEKLGNDQNVFKQNTSTNIFFRTIINLSQQTTLFNFFIFSHIHPLYFFCHPTVNNYNIANIQQRHFLKRLLKKKNKKKKNKEKRKKKSTEICTK